MSDPSGDSNTFPLKPQAIKVTFKRAFQTGGLLTHQILLFKTS